jgi:ferric-dicitrate binding protein FerR (iron transport regulator)
MNDEVRPSAEEARVQAALRGLAVPPADPAFRTDLRRRFVSGALAGPARDLRRPARPWFLRLPVLAVGAAAAAAVVVLAILPGLNRGPAWEAADPLATGQVVLDGVSLTLPDDAALLARHLQPGARVGRPDSTGLDLIAAGQLWIEITPGSEVVLPATAGRWWDRSLAAEVRGGEVRFTTGPAFAGAQLRIATETAQVELLGSTIAVIDSPESTCVCVYAGTVRVGPRTGDLELVPVGMRKIVFADGSPPVVEEITGMERMKLQMLEDRAFPR